MKTIKVSEAVAAKIEELARERGISLREAADLTFSSVQVGNEQREVGKPAEVAHTLQDGNADLQLQESEQRAQVLSAEREQLMAQLQTGIAEREEAVQAYQRSEATVKALKSQLHSYAATVNQRDNEVQALREVRDRLSKELRRKHAQLAAKLTPMPQPAAATERTPPDDPESSGSEGSSLGWLWIPLALLGAWLVKLFISRRGGSNA